MGYNQNNYNQNRYQQFQQPQFQQPQIKLGTYMNGNVWTKNGWKPYKKRSGASEHRGKTTAGKDFFGVSAWCYSKSAGRIKISGFENERSTRFQNKQGEKSMMLMFEVLYQDTGNKVLEIAQYKMTTGKARLKRLGIDISTKAANGGYCGFISKK